MRRIVLAAVLLQIASATLPVHAAGQCDMRLELYREAKKTCASTGRYCGDVPLYREAAVEACGAAVVAQMEGEGGQQGGEPPSSEPPANEGHADADDATLPRSCAYFTKEATDGVRLNYHGDGAMVCWQDVAYECQTDANGVKSWVKRAPCSVFTGISQACAVEGTC